MNLYRLDTPIEQHFALFRTPNYYDSPEGTNPWEKIWGLNKYVIPAAIFGGMFRACYYDNPQNIFQSANIIGYYLLPAIGGATAFASVTYIAARLRGKDDKINYVCGVLACAPILQAWKKSTSTTLFALQHLLLIAIFRKHAEQEGWDLFPQLPSRKTKNYTYDFSLVENTWPRRPI